MQHCINEVRLYRSVNCYKMGRKIPGKKHKTVKDPYKQRQKRLDSIRLKVNNPPSNVDDQEIPKSLLELVKLKKKAKQSAVKKHKKKSKRLVSLSVAKLLDKEPVVKGISKPDDFIPDVVQKPNESVQSFLRRVSSMTQDLINEVEFERKFGVEIKKNSETGEIIEVKKLKNKKRSKKKKLIEKRKAKLIEKKDNLKNIKDFNQLKDKVEFGETVHRPPDLKIKKLENKNQKPKFSTLLLNKVVEDTQTECKNSQSNLERERKENERKFIVEAYRKLKKKLID